ncbi:LuxR C-terminal-related transcriptional regulator [Streptomyces acidicola]|uniref:Response regulator transcription factor n=1 Tax=Streptomyces acidicola TaxID=2596892 RepID=A0A5N8WR83_9ACTN|nr:response regulator transcription factor [Streptomyces acidicola]MPY49767.1 response regulator transcription factor [Streptomyces acidicola]
MPQQTLQQAPTGTVRVAINAPDYLTRAGLVSCLQHDRRLSEVRPGEHQKADTVVVAVDVADGSTLDLLAGLREGSRGRFVMVVGRQWRADVSAAVGRGVRAVLWRNSLTPEAFVGALLTVAAGGTSLPPALRSTLVEHVRSTRRDVLPARPPSASGVSPRELDVLRLIAEGEELSAIAVKLSYSERTIKYILYGVMNRLQLRNRPHAVSYAIRAGLI